MADPVILDVAGVSVRFDTERGPVTVLDDVSFTVKRGTVVGIVGESGSGKSVTGLAIMGLLGAQGSVTAGSIRLAGESLVAKSPEEMRQMRGKRMGMVFQEPMNSLNPLLTIGFQIAEAFRVHFPVSAATAKARAIEMLDQVGIPSAARRFGAYPHEFSGGMRQRAMIAMAMICSPQLLIADEPTTALDVTIQAQILDLVRQLRDREKSTILLITHDMGVIARMADSVVVMYAGEVVEMASLRQIFGKPLHPYSALLLASTPTVRAKVDRLPMIAGSMASPSSLPAGCRFHPRCPLAIDICRSDRPPLQSHADGRQSRCWRSGELLSGAVEAVR